MCIVVAACGDSSGTAGADAGSPAADAATANADATTTLDATVDAAPVDRLTAARDRLLADYSDGADVCVRWDQLDDSQRAVFLTLTHRLFISATPDGLSMLEHMTALHLILGGGADGTDCGGSENNRLFLSMDDYLWQLMVDTWNGTDTVGDGGGGLWKHTADFAGPHDPFTASNETDSGLRCALIVELPESRPPTGQGHFFLPGDQVAVQRGPGIDLPADPYMFEIDHDFDCLHQSNPLCPGRGFAAKYVDNYGDYGAAWQPSGCP